MPRLARGLLCLPFVSLLYACAESGTAVLEESTGRDPVTVQTTTVQPGSWTHSFKSYGVVHPAEEYSEAGSLTSTPSSCIR